MNYRTPAEEMYPSAVGRYLLHQPIARGGMATVHAARLMAAEGVTRLVAAKRLHPQYVDDPEFVAMFHDEARIASCIHHPNVVPVLDVIHDGEEVILVQEYVHGVPLSNLIKYAIAERRPIALGIVLTIISGVLSGLHAAHEATDDVGEPLGIVHRDVSPQNVLVSVDGIPRLVDFGIAKARTSMHHTREGFLKGKLSYMAPEQLRGEGVTRAVDIYAAGVLLWELVVNRRFYDGGNDPEFVRAVALGATMTPTRALEVERKGVISAERWAQVYLLEPIISRAMASAPEARFSTAAEMAAALAEIARNAPTPEVSSWVRDVGAEFLEKRQRMLIANEEPEPPRSSGARRRVDVVLTIEPEPSQQTLPETKRLGKPARRPVWTPRSIEAVRRAFPWALSLVLLVAVCVLGGMAIERAPLRVPMMTRHIEPPPITIEVVPMETPAVTIVEPSATLPQPKNGGRPPTAPIARFGVGARGAAATPPRSPGQKKIE
jgi:serine/threonine protein kinase